MSCTWHHEQAEGGGDEGDESVLAGVKVCECLLPGTMSRPKEGVTRVMPTMEAMIVMELANSCNRDRERERERERELRKRGEKIREC